MKTVDPAWPLWAATATVDDTGPVWVAADESGSSGENLVDPQGGVFAHASVRIDDETAGPLLADLRQRAGATQSPEAKFAQFRTRRGREALAGALAPGGALENRVVITVADKRYLIVSKMIDLLVEELTHEQGIDLYTDGTARKLAVTLFRDGPRGLGELWDPLMAAFVSLARATQRGGGEKETVDSFFARLDQARWRCRRRSVEPLLDLLLQTRAHADDLVLSRAQRRSSLSPGLDPLVTMLPMTMHHAYADHGAVRFLHDEQKLFSPEFVQELFPLMWHVHPDFAGHVPRTRVAEFWTGDSREHPSIQLADLAASAGRVVVEDLLGSPTEIADALKPAVMPLIREHVAADLPL
jgi:hypothetical protein